MFIFPLLVGAGALALLYAGRKGGKAIDDQGNIAVPKKVREVAKKNVSRAIAERDWQKAAANALASGLKVTVVGVAKAMRDDGFVKEAKSLVRAFKEMQESAEDKAPPRKKAAPRKRQRPAVAAPRARAALPAAPKKKRAKKPISPKKKVALQMAKMLRASARYKEDRALVEKYQAQEGLGADGLYGQGTARSLYERYQIIPPNPYYWPRANASSAVISYSKFLDSIPASNDSTRAYLKALKETVGK